MASDHSQGWTAMGAALVGLVVGTILMDTTRYFDYFSDTDKKWVRGGVALGSFLSLHVILPSHLRLIILSLTTIVASSLSPAFRRVPVSVGGDRR